jgi:cell division FtsZ-interacting protein ZapD
MHGFVNVFLCSALVRVKGLDVERAEAVLQDEDPAAFKFSNELVSWRGHGLGIMELAKLRETFALSFGSCSFDEPLADLRSIGWFKDA